MYKKDDVINARYKIIKLLGSGANGDVYLAEDGDLSRRVIRNSNLIAIKILKKKFNEDDVVVKRFLQEYQIGIKLVKSKYIIETYHYDKSEDEEHFFTMKFVEGKNLRQVIDEKGALPLEDACLKLFSIADALSDIHAKGYIHRDLKPENIYITHENEVLITDFGISLTKDELRLTMDNRAPGTLHYMSKASQSGLEVNEKTDIYSLGIVAFEMLTGKTPRECLSMDDIQNGSIYKIPDMSDCGANVTYRFQKFVEDCATEAPKDGFQSMGEVLAEISTQGGRLHLPAIYYKAKHILRRVDTIYYNLLFAFIIAFACLYLGSNIPGKRYSGLVNDIFENRILDSWFQIRGAIDSPKDIAIVSFDEQTRTKYSVPYDADFPREIMAKTIEAVSKFHPKAIALDYKFGVLKDPVTDKRLREAIQDTKAILAVNKEKIRKEVNGKEQIVSNAITSHAYFHDIAGGHFIANSNEQSGEIRKFYYELEGDNYFPTISKLIYGENASNEELPLYNEFINYYGDNGTISRESAYKLIEEPDTIPESMFKNKIVLFGTHFFLNKNVEVRDMHAIPGKRKMSGVEILATILGNIKDQTWIKRLPVYYELLLTLFLSVIFGFIVLNAKEVASFILYIILSSGIPTLSLVCFYYNYYIPFVSILLSISIAVVLKGLIFGGKLLEGKARNRK